MSDERDSQRRGRVFWGGFRLSAWLRLLARNRFAVDAPFRGAALKTTLMCGVSSLLGLVQDVCYGSSIRRTALRGAPVFVIGHWRSGTTFLIDLLCRDERFASPDTYEGLFPGHFLISRAFVTRRYPLGGTRVVDRVRVGWDLPREDEFALCALGLPSPYLTAAFPNHPPQDLEYLDLCGLSAQARHAWTRTFLRFLQAVTFAKGKRLLLKSPTHTARLRVLHRLFPEARFVHIVRNPFAVIPSTLRLWRTMFERLGLQTPTFTGLEEMVFANFERVYRRLEEDRRLIPPSHFHELRYEELVADPLGKVRSIYEHLDLGDFEPVRPALESYLAGLRDYETNRHQVGPELCAGIGRHCGEVLRCYGYANELAASHPLPAGAVERCGTPDRRWNSGGSPATVSE